MITIKDSDVLAFVRANCNAAEIAAFAGCGEDYARAWVACVLREMSGQAGGTIVSDAELYDRGERGYVARTLLGLPGFLP